MVDSHSLGDSHASRPTTSRAAPASVSPRSGPAFGLQELRKARSQAAPARAALPILTLLLERAGEVVTREELRGGSGRKIPTIDFDHGLNKAISKIRRMLWRIPPTAPDLSKRSLRRGYRFLADVKVYPLSSGFCGDYVRSTSDSSSDQEISDPELAESSPAGRSNRPSIWAISAVVALVLLILTASFFRSRKITSNSVNSIAVLPLENLSNDTSQDYFADGMTDQLITDLGQIGALRVISRTTVMQYKGVHKPIAQIGKRIKRRCNR